MAKSRTELEREVKSALGKYAPSSIKRRYPYFDDDARAPQSAIKEPWNNHRPRRQDQRDPTLPKDETFALIDRDGKVLATAKSVVSVISKAPKGTSDLIVRGEYVSTGAHYGLGRGRMLARRELGRWTIG